MVIKICFLSLLNLCRNELERGSGSTDVGTALPSFRARSRPCLVGSSPQTSLEDSGWNHTFSRHGSAAPGASASEGWCWDRDPGLGCQGLTSSSPFDAFWNVPGSAGVSAPGTFKLTRRAFAESCVWRKVSVAQRSLKTTRRLEETVV